jgi:hypothetical protein
MAAFLKAEGYPDGIPRSAVVSALGLTEQDATRLQIGFTRGNPIRNEDGSISGFIGYADGQLKVPPQWIGTNVVTFPKKSA